MKKMWIMMYVPKEGIWEFMGVFDTKEKAVKACTKWNDYIFSSTLNKRLPRKPSYAPDGFYPVAEKGENK